MMCVRINGGSSEAMRLRRLAGVLAASSASLAAAPALLRTHAHPVFGWALIGVQACLITVAFGMLARAKRLG